MTTLPAATVAPRSPTNRPRNSLSLSSSSAHVNLSCSCGPARSVDRQRRRRACSPLQPDCNGAARRWPPCRDREGGPHAGQGRRHRGIRRAGRGQGRVRGLRRRPGHRPARADLADRPLPDVEGAGALPVPALPGHHGRPPRQRPLGPADDPAAYATSPTPRPDRRAGRGRAGRAVSAGSAWAPGGPPWPSPATRSGSRVIALPARARTDPAVRRTASTSASTRVRDLRGMGEVQPALLGARLPASRVLLRPALPEPHSTKQREDAVGWALETIPQTMIANDAPRSSRTRPQAEALVSLGAVPVLAVQGTDDHASPGPLSASQSSPAARRVSRAAATCQTRATR